MKRHIPYTGGSVDPEIQRMKALLTSSEDIVIEVGKEDVVPGQSGSNESICDSEDEFIIKTVETELQNLSSRDKETLLEKPHPVMRHFGYGMYIRNRYIHGKQRMTLVEHRCITCIDIFGFAIAQHSSTKRYDFPIYIKYRYHGSIPELVHSTFPLGYLYQS